MNRPIVAFDPGMQSGVALVGHSRLPVESVIGEVWAGAPLDVVAHEYGCAVEEVTVACWFVGVYGVTGWGPRGGVEGSVWRKRWGAWAKQVHGSLWSGQYDVPPPPTESDHLEHKEAS